MCWSPEASVVIAAVSVGVTAYGVKKQLPLGLTATLAFFASMEVLQAFSYSVVDQCSLPANQWATRLAYLHIMLQPFFFNALALEFIPRDVKARVQGWVYGACAVSALFMLWQVLPSQSFGQCAAHRGLCGPDFCTYSGNFHLAWEMPINGFGNGWAHHENWFVRLFPYALPTYAFTVMILPIIYGAWKISAYQYLMGPLIVENLPLLADERPAVWCLMSFGIAALIIFTPLRDRLQHRSWPLWNRLRGHPA